MGVAVGGVGYEGDAAGAVGAVVEELEVLEGSDAVEELLWCVSLCIWWMEVAGAYVDVALCELVVEVFDADAGAVCG